MKCCYFVGLLSLLWFSATSLVSKTPDVPEKVKETFKRHYSDARNVRWEKEEEGYEAEFKLNGLNMSVVIDSMGVIQETEIEIPTSELPADCKNNLPPEYKGVKIKEAGKIIKTDGTVFYEAEVKGRDFFFSDNGLLLTPRGISF